MKNSNYPGNRTWRILYPSLTYYGINFLISMVFIIAATSHLMLEKGIMTYEVLMENYDLLMQEVLLLTVKYNYEMTILIAAISIPVMAYFMARDRKRERALGLYREYEKVEPAYYGAAILLGISACLTVNHLLDISGLTGVYAQNLEEMSNVLYQGNLALELIGVGIIVPIAEELVFRGLTMRRLEEFLGPGMAIVLSAFVFACYHGNILQGIYAFIMGLLMGYVYERYKSIVAPIILHVSANVISVLISETAILLPVYENDILYMGITVLAAVLTLCAVGVIQYRVEPECLTKPPVDQPDDTENPDPYNIR